MTRLSRSVLTATAAAASLALFAGCSGSGGDSGADSGSTGAPVTVGYSTDGGQNYDPAKAGNQYVSVYLLPAYDSLLNVDDSGEVGPGLAESFELSDDGKTLTLQLRQGVKFHDGATLTADAVKKNFERSMGDEGSVLKADFASVESIDASDESTVVVQLKNRDAAFLSALADRAGMMISPDALSNPDLDLQPVGAGPYMVTEHLPGSSISYEKFDEYWNPDHAGTPKLTLKMIVDPEARLRAISTGEIDIAALGQDQGAAAEQAGLSVTAMEPKTMPLMIYLNMKEGSPLHDPQVRKAISLAIDRQGISETILEGNCEPTGQLFTSDYWAASSEVKAPERDVEEAKKLLADAGYADGFTMSLSAISAAPYRVIAEAEAAQLAEIGIDVDLQISEPTKVVSDFNGQKTTDAYTSLWPGATDPAKTFASLYQPTGLFNPGAYEDEELLSLLDEGRTAATHEDRAAAYAQANERAADQAVQIPVCSSKALRAEKSPVEGIRLTAAGTVDYSEISIEE